jgi:DNA modification methylase
MIERVPIRTTQLVLPEFATELIDLDPIQATFSGGAQEPFCRWYPYLEGYSPEFVEAILRELAPAARVVLDPFGGTATTAFVAAERGLQAYICEVNPVMQFIFEVKTDVRRLDSTQRRQCAVHLNELRSNLAQHFVAVEPDKVLHTSYLQSFGQSQFFAEMTFDQILRARTLVDEIATTKPLLAQLLAVAILASLVSCSYLKRAGDLRYKTSKEFERGIPSFIGYVKQRLSDMIEDLERSNTLLEVVPLLICDDARKLAEIPFLGIDAVITSPPYINGTNYFRNTKIELWFLRCLQTNKHLAEYRYKAITAGINDVTVGKSSPPHHPSVAVVVRELELNAYDQRIPRMIASYFAELSAVFNGIRQHLTPDATVAIDIGDSIYGGVHIPADELIVECLADLGFNLHHRIDLRRRRSKNGALLKQVLLVLKYTRQDSPQGAVAGSPRWHQAWQEFSTTLPHQAAPYAARNWGSRLHSLCSYQGKLKPAIAHHLVQIFVPQGGVMLDPFAGVGTLPFEAALQGRKAYGFDLSPAAYIISQAKLAIPRATQTAEIITTLTAYIETYAATEADLLETRTFGFNGKLVEYYHPHTLREILAARRFFREHDKVTPSLLLVEAACLHILHGNRPYAVSRRSHPITPYAPTGDFEYRPLIPRLREKVQSALAALPDATFIEGQMYFQDATSWWPLEVNALDAVITSPPFFDSTRFYLANWLRLWFTGWSAADFKEKPLAFVDERQKQSFAVYQSIFRQAKERLKTGGVVVLHLGKSRKCDMATEIAAVGRKWFAHAEVFDESVAHCESHGIRDKGTVTDHQYLALY